MRLLQHLTRWISNGQLKEIAALIAERSQREVARRVCERIANMPTAERRGYVRARASAVVLREIENALLEDQRLELADRHSLAELAVELLIDTVCTEGLTRLRRRAA